MLHEALKAAVQAAEAAGDMIRAEIHRPGGPRGYGSKADVDPEAEAVIRNILLAACPYALLGEELGAVGTPGDGPTWLVDPHDGTSAFLEGFVRGTAVSIGLVADGLPILGVVHVPAWPGERGETFAWAEGCGPLTRNGVPVTIDLSRRDLEPGAIVAVSQAADRKPGINAALVTPGRFLAIPSVAHRLARAACGDAVAAVSLAAPVAWDTAGGHALLRAVGGEIYDQCGDPIRYHSLPGSGVLRCFGGAPTAALRLVAADWDAPLTAPAWPRGFRPRPMLGRRRVPDAGRLDRAQGCLAGALAGDALGSRLGSTAPSAIRQGHPAGVGEHADGGVWHPLAGQPTSDGEMTLVLARAILAAGGYDIDGALDAYAGWLESGPFDVGPTTRTALSAAAEVANESSEANGSLMRIPPLGIAWAGNPLAAAAAARADSALTHPNPAAVGACAAQAAAIARLVAGGSRAEAHAAAVDAIRGGPATEALRAVVECPSTAADMTSHRGWGLLALGNALHHLVAGSTIEEALVATAARGGDTDTNAAVVGALLGAADGLAAMPRRWLLPVITCRADSLGGAQRPRPAWLWADDLAEIAEALLALSPAA